jgi:integrase
MATGTGKRGRPTKFKEFDELLASCPKVMRRPQYHDRIGVRRGPKGDTVWIKVQLPNGGSWKGKQFKPGHALEVKMGWKASTEWEHAISVRDDLQSRADKGQPLEDKPVPTFEDHARDWLKRKNGTVEDFGTIRMHVELHLLPTFGKKLINQIEKNDVEHWIAAKRIEERSIGYIKRINNTLKAILYDAKGAKIIDSNPAIDIEAIKGTFSRERFLDAEEIVRLLVAAEEVELWLADIIVWALHSGMRRGEIQSMKWSDIRTLPDGGKIAILESTKSGKPRSVICTKGMLEVLERQADRREDGDGRVFPISKMTWRRRWEKARKNAGLEDIDFHDLRRTNATQAAASGVDLRTLAARIGHTDLAMLEKHYAMVVGSAEHEAAEKIQDTFDRLTANVVPMKGS